MEQSNRACSTCGVVKPGNGVGTRATLCKECYNAVRRARRLAAAPTIACAHCGMLFVRAKGSMKLCSPECVARNIRIRRGVPQLLVVKCPGCKVEFQQIRSDSTFCSTVCMDRAKYKRNSASPEWVTARNAKATQEYAANAEAMRARAAIWRDANRAKSREYGRTWAREHQYSTPYSWRQLYPERHAAKERLRQSRIRALTPFRISHEDVMLKVSYWGDKCWMCDGPFEAVDHVKPISKGGLNVLANMRPACISCNSKKRNKWFGVLELDQFLQTE